MKNIFIIGIAGGTGSGKTTIVNAALKELNPNDICVISQDSYYKSTSNMTFEERKKINFDHPSSIDFKLLTNHLINLKKGKTINQPIYSFKEHNRTEKTKKILPVKIVLVEGILIFNSLKIRNLCDIKIYIEADDDERLIRRIKRDVKERGRDTIEVINRYQNTLKPMHKQFIEPTKNFADVIIMNNQFNLQSIKILKTLINEHL